MRTTAACTVAAADGAVHAKRAPVRQVVRPGGLGGHHRVAGAGKGRPVGMWEAELGFLAPRMIETHTSSSHGCS